MKLKQGLVLFLGVGLAFAITLSYLAQQATPKIKEHEEAKARALMESMKPANQPHLHLDPFILLAPNYLKMGDIQMAARLMNGNQVIQVIYRAVSHEGYAGEIGLMASFDRNCTVQRLEIIKERETPGLGDQYKHDGGTWLNSFKGQSNLSHIETWTGATVTPKAIIKAVHRMQSLCQHEHELLFSHEKEVYLEIGKPDENLP